MRFWLLLSASLFPAAAFAESPFDRALGDLGCTGEQCAAIQRLTVTHSPEKVREVAHWLKAHGVRRPAQAILLVPELLDLTPELHFDPTYDYLVERGVPDVGRVLEKEPEILRFDLEERVHPAFECLIYRLGFTVPEIGSHPEVLLASPEELEALADWAQVARVSLRNLPVQQRAQVAQYGVVPLVHNFRLILKAIKEHMRDRLTLAHSLPQVIPRLENAGNLPLVLQASQLTPADLSTCVRMLYLVGVP